MPTARLSERDATDARIWFYLKLYPSRLDLLDAVVTEVVPDLVAGADDWFFLRYVDGVGPHVRLRRLVDRDTADDLWAGLDGSRAKLSDIAARSPRPDWGVLAIDAAAADFRGRWTVEPDLYEPETAKWGTGQALAAAHRLFAVSSRDAVRCPASLDGSATSRVILGTSVIIGVLDRLGLDARQARAFLSQHYAWWSGSAHDPDRSRDSALRASLAELDPDAVLARLGPDRPVATFTEALASAVRSSSGPHKPIFVVFHQLHLMLNRLGVVPSEEAVCSLLASRHYG